MYKRILLKTPNSSSCSKANAALALSTTHQQEPATNYSCPLHHQSNTGISQVNEGASTSINHEHFDCTENSLVKEHVFEIELDAKNPDEISSSPNTSASINPEHHDCTENWLQSVNKHVFEIQLDAENPNEISSSPNVPTADLPEIPFPIETCNTESEHINKLQSLVAQEFAQNSDSDIENEEVPPDYFRIEDGEHPTQFRRCPSTFELNYFDNNLITSPIIQYPRDQILQSHEDVGWKVSFPDEMPLQGPFIVNASLKVEMTTKNLEDFFFLNLDDCMFKTIADQANAYARNRISSIMYGRDLIQQLDDPINKKHNHLHSWKDINAADIKLFMAHVIVMSLGQKSAVHGYWLKKTLSHTLFFGKYLSCNKFQTILWHLHFNDVSSNTAPALQGHDPLACLRNIISMAQYNFKHVSIPSADVAIDDSTCTF